VGTAAPGGPGVPVDVSGNDGKQTATEEGGVPVSEFVLREASVLDEGGGFTAPLDVHVREGRVAAVGEDVRADAPSVDGAGLWLLPAIFDCHDHVAFSMTCSSSCRCR
jgi:N-acyl-D-aspartate/D-glutamate deacylase